MNPADDEESPGADVRPSELPRESIVAPGASRALHPMALAAIVAAVSAAAFAISYDGPWIYDDHSVIEHNGWVQSGIHWKRWFTHDMWDVNEDKNRYDTAHMVYWRPIVLATYALDWAVGGGATWTFHLTNLLWQALVGFLGYRALMRWIGKPIPALLGALLFTLHPTKAESVAWIAGRTDVLCTAMLLLAAEGVSLRARARTPRLRAAGIGLEIVATMLAYATKEQSLVLPAFVAIEVWAASGRDALRRPVVVRMLRAAAPQVVVAAFYLLCRRWLLPVARGNPFAFGEHLALIGETFGRFFAATLWPADLSIQKALLHTERGKVVLHPGYAAFGWISVATLVALAWRARRRAPLISLGIAFFFATILPTSNVVPTGMVTLISDRFLYMPMLGLALALAAAVELVPASSRRAALLSLVAIATGFFGLSALRSADFLDETEFWAREAKLHPDSLEAIRFELDADMRERRFHAALVRAGNGMQIASRSFAHTGWESSFIVYGVRLVAALTPDREVDRLKAIARFCDAAAAHESPIVRLELPDVSVAVTPGHGAAGARLDTEMPRLRMLRADIASRLGDDALATSLARDVVTGCPGCRELVHHQIMIEARAGRYDEAFAAMERLRRLEASVVVSNYNEVLRRAALASKQAAAAPEGPLQMNLRASELATLDAWGRAYALLSPHKDLIKHAPGMAYGFAELAFRAGFTDVAREMLGGLVPPEKIASTEQRWARRMGWVDEGPEDAPAAVP